MTQDTDNQAVSELIGQIMGAIADQAAQVSDALIDSHKHRGAVVSEALVAIVNAIDASQIVDRSVMRVIDSSVVVRGLATAETILARRDGDGDS